MRRLDTILGTPGRIRIGTWRGDADVALLSPVPGAPPAPELLARTLSAAAARGHHVAITPALPVGERAVFLDAGFHELERLHLLRHPLDRIPPASADGVAFRRGRPRDLSEVLALDALAFDTFWRFDRDGLLDARSATPRARYRVATDPTGRIVGYHITGVAGHLGFLQRLGVHPDAEGRGIGTALVGDALAWCRRRRCSSVLVNTQESNERARRLYLHLGFDPEPDGLAVLTRRLDEVLA